MIVIDYKLCNKIFQKKYHKKENGNVLPSRHVASSKFALSFACFAFAKLRFVFRTTSPLPTILLRNFAWSPFLFAWLHARNNITFCPKQKPQISLWSVLENGNVLPSRHVAMQVLSALRSLTSVFGMRTGGPPRHYHRYGIIARFLLELSML